jgi:trigger factor
VRGKKVAYKISVHGIYAKKLPELNDEFAKSLNMDVETVDALKEKIKSDLVAKAEGDTTSESQGALLELIASENEFKVPPSLIDDEIREMVLRMGFAGQDAKPESIDVEQFRPHFEETAIQRLKVAIVVDRIGAQEDVQVEEADTKAMIEKIAEQNGVTVEVATKALLDKSRIGGFFAEVRRTKIVDRLMSRTTVNFVTDAETKKEKSSAKKGGKAKKTSAAA